MKKLFLIIAVIPLLFSCGESKTYSVSITNDSSKIVSYTYNNKDETLDVGDYKIYEVEAYTQPPKDIKDGSGIASIEITKRNYLKDEYFFILATGLALSVRNYSSADVSIKADNFIDNGAGGTVLTIDAGETETATIYTRNPKFTSTSSFPINIEWVIDENKMYVSIR